MWFAPEHLDIIPDQIWGKIIPDAIAAAFHGHACVPPDQTRARIEMEGVAQLSRRVTDPQNQLAPLVSLSSYILCAFVFCFVFLCG